VPVGPTVVITVAEEEREISLLTEGNEPTPQTVASLPRGMHSDDVTVGDKRKERNGTSKKHMERERREKGNEKSEAIGL
jgi:hypothetical protein